jgi:alpha-mannosidase
MSPAVLSFKWSDTQPWRSGADALIRALRDGLALTAWRFSHNLRGAERVDLDDRTWERRTAPLSWSCAEGPRVLRAVYVVPERLEGVPLAGSRIHLHFLHLSWAQLFVDGRKVYEHRFWADTRLAEFPIVENAVPGNRHVLVFKSLGTEGSGSFHANLRIEPVNDALFEIQAVRCQLDLARCLADWERSALLRRALADACACLDPAALAARDWPAIRRQLAAVESALEPFRPAAQRYTCHLIGHAHIDMNWLWPYSDTVDICLRDVATATNLMRKHPDFTFSQSQAKVYQIVQERRPALLREVRRRIREGRWEVTAATWVEGDLNMAKGESLARHLLYAREYATRMLGAASAVCWEPDTFGHPATLPTVLADAGLGGYYFIRCGKRLPLFRWQGPDGRSVLAYDSRTSYGVAADAEVIADKFAEFGARYHRLGVRDFLLVYGVGDHGGGPTELDIRKVRALRLKPVMPRLEFSTATRFFAAVRPFVARLPKVAGELNPTYEGCYTTHADIKRANREGQRALLELETLAALAWPRHPGRLRSDLRRLWQDFLFIQFHDILDGCAIPATYRDAARRVRSVLRRADVLRQKALARLLAGPDSGRPCVHVLNPLGWERDALVELECPRGLAAPLEAIGPDGCALPVEKHGRRIGFHARALPAWGRRTYVLRPGTAAPAASVRLGDPQAWLQDGLIFDLPLYTLIVDRHTGLIKRLRDNRLGRDLILTQDSWWDPSVWGQERCGGRLAVDWEKPHVMSAWLTGSVVRTDHLFNADSVTHASDACRTVVTVKQRYRESTLERRMILYPDRPYVDFELDVDWQEPGGPQAGVPVLRTEFTFNLDRPRAWFDIPFGVIERPTIRREWPALSWAALQERDYAVALLSRDKHGFRVDGASLGLTLLRNAYEPDPASDLGRHHMAYRLLFGRLTNLDLARAAADYEQPVVAQTGRAAGPDEWSGLVRVSGHVLVTALKPALAGNGLVLRLADVLGRRQRVTLSFRKRPAEVRLANVLEQPGPRLPVDRAGRVRLDVHSRALVTILMRW